MLYTILVPKRPLIWDPRRGWTRGRIAAAALLALAPALLALGAADLQGWPDAGLLPAAEAHSGPIHVTSAKTVGSNTVLVTYSGSIAPPSSRQVPQSQCYGAFGCAFTGYKTVWNVASRYSDVVMNPGGAMGIANVTYSAYNAHLIHLSGSVPSDATGSFSVAASGSVRWTNSEHSHTRAAATVPISDGRGPSLSGGASLDLSSGLLGFALDEGAGRTDPSKMSVAGISLDGAQASQSGASVTVRLTEAQRSQLSAVQDRSGGLSADLSAGAFTDSAGNASGARAGVALSLTKDTSPPALVSSDMDLGAGTLELEFSENVDLSEMDLSKASLASSAGSSRLSLAGSQVSETDDSSTVTVLLTPAQKASILFPSAYEPGASYGFVDAERSRYPVFEAEKMLDRLDAEPSAFRDLAGIRIGALAGERLSVSHDRTPPSILGEPILYLSDGTLQVELDEYASPRFVLLSRISIAGPSGALPLDGAGLSSDGDTLRIKLTDAQKKGASLMQEPLSLRVGADSIRDIFLNSAAAGDFAMSVHADRQGPSLERASLDEGTGSLSIWFTEIVDVTPKSEVDLSKISLRAPRQAPSEGVALSGDETASISTGSDSARLDIVLSEGQRSALAAAGGGTLLLVTERGAVHDLLGNQLAAEDRFPVTASADRRAPSAVSASLDKATGALTVVFDETVDSSRADPSGLHLRPAGPLQVQAASAHAQGHTSLASAAVAGTASASLKVRLTEAQRQAALLYADPPALDIDAGAVSDSAGNPVGASTVAVSFSGEDDRPPALLSASFDAGTGLLALSFDETIDATPPSRIDLSKMAVSDAVGASSLTLSSSSASAPSVDSAGIAVVLADAQRLAVAAMADPRLHLAAGAVYDVPGNPVQERTGVPLPASSDRAGPSLVSASVSGAHYVTAVFSEDLLDSSVEAGDFEVRGHRISHVSETGGEVQIHLITRVFNVSGETLRVSMTGAVSDSAGNELDGSSGLVYADAPNDLEFADALVFKISSDNQNGSYARAGDRLVLTFESDVDILPAASVTINSRTAAVSAATPSSFVATYVVSASDAEGPVDVSVEVTADSGHAAKSSFGNADFTSGGTVTVDLTPPAYLSATLAGRQSMHVHYSEQVATSAGDYTGIHPLCDGCSAQDASSASNPLWSPHVLVSWSSQTPDLRYMPVEFSVGAGVADLAGNAVSNPGAKRMDPPENHEATGRIHLTQDAGASGVALAHDTLVHTVLAPRGTVPVIDVSAFGDPDSTDHGVLNAGGGRVQFPPAPEGITVGTSSSTVTFPPGVQAGGFPDADGQDSGHTITVDVSQKDPDAQFLARYPGVDSDSALILEFGRHDADITFSMPVRVELKTDIWAGSAVFTIDSEGRTLELLDCGAGVSDTRSAERFLDSIAPSASPTVDGQACVDRASDTIWTRHFSAFGAATPAAGPSGCDGDCTPPTMGVAENGARIVSGGFSYNGGSADVQLYFTPYPRIDVLVGSENTAVLKVYDDSGPDSVRHVSLAFGLRSGQVISESKAEIAWNSDHAGNATVTVTDPGNALDSETVRVSESQVACAEGSPNECLQLEIRHMFRAPLEFDMVGTNVWDAERNSWQNYYNHGVRVSGESLNGEPGALVNGGQLRLYPISAGSTLTDVMADSAGQLYRLAPDGQYRPLTNSSSLYHEADESRWVRSHWHEPIRHDRSDPGFAGQLQEQASRAQAVLDGMTRGSPITNPGFGAPAELVRHEIVRTDRASDEELQLAILDEQERAELLYSLLFG